MRYFRKTAVDTSDPSVNGETVLTESMGTKMADNEVGIILFIFRWLMPPKISDSPERQHAWRQTVAFVLFVLLIIGAISAYVDWKFQIVDGYARQSDVTALATQTNSHFATTDYLLKGLRTDMHNAQVRDVSNQLFSLRVDISRDTTDEDKQRDCQRFTDLSEQYQNLTAESYGFEPQACDSL